MAYHASEPGRVGHRTAGRQRRGRRRAGHPVREGARYQDGEEPLHFDLRPLETCRSTVWSGSEARVNIGQPGDVSWVVMADPEGTSSACSPLCHSLRRPARKRPHHEAVPSATAAPRRAESSPGRGSRCSRCSRPGPRRNCHTRTTPWRRMLRTSSDRGKVGEVCGADRTRSRDTRRNDRRASPS